MSEEFWMALAAPSLLVVSFVSGLIDRYAVNSDEEYAIVERRRAIQWGRHAGRLYLFIELPSWDWRREVLRDRFCWHRRVIVWLSDKGWFMWYQPSPTEQP